MQNKTYSIKEASEVLELESHTLRYYEDELELKIPRNSIGHRYYRNYDIQVFKHIIDLKEQGLQLKAIRNAIQSSYDPLKGEDWQEAQETYLQATTALSMSPKGNFNDVAEAGFDITDINNTKVEQFRLMMKETFVQAIYENQEELKSELNHHIKYKIEEDMKEEIQKIENVYEEKDKERYRKLDETMREMQKIRSELIDITEQKKGKKSLFVRMFGKKNIEIEEDKCVIEE